jgi:hypothetical protein
MRIPYFLTTFRRLCDAFDHEPPRREKTNVAFSVTFRSLVDTLGDKIASEFQGLLMRERTQNEGVRLRM